MKKLCLVAVSTLAMIVATAAPAAAAAPQVPTHPTGIFCKLFPLLCT